LICLVELRATNGTVKIEVLSKHKQFKAENQENLSYLYIRNLFVHALWSIFIWLCK